MVIIHVPTFHVLVSFFQIGFTLVGRMVCNFLNELRVVRVLIRARDISNEDDRGMTWDQIQMNFLYRGGMYRHKSQLTNQHSV